MLFSPPEAGLVPTEIGFLKFVALRTQSIALTLYALRFALYASRLNARFQKQPKDELWWQKKQKSLAHQPQLRSDVQFVAKMNSLDFHRAHQNAFQLAALHPTPMNPVAN
jgi:hypothetical protein